MDTQNIAAENKSIETALRPRSLDEFIGHCDVRSRLKILVDAAKGRGEALGHILFHGPPGLGKTTLSYILAHEMGSGVTLSSGPAIEKAGDLAGILTNLQEGDVLFIDEIHRLPRQIEEYLYSAMEEYSLDLMLDSGPNARCVRISLNRFTLVGATTKVGSLSAPLRSRFHNTLRLEYYDRSSLSKIIHRSAGLLGVTIDSLSCDLLALRSRGTPRIANNLLRWVRDYAQLHSENSITDKTIETACKMLAIDHLGLDEMDKKILSCIINHYQGGPVGIKAIATFIGEEEMTIEEVYEPYLIMQGFIKRTPRGRETTKMAYDHIKQLSGGG